MGAGSMSWRRTLFNKTTRRDLVVSLSLANLMFMRLWMKLLPYRSGNNYYLEFSPLNSYLAVVMNVIMWGGILFLLISLFKRHKCVFSWFVPLIYFIVSVILFYGVGVAYISVARFVSMFGPKSANLLIVSCWLSGLLFIFLLVKNRGWLARHYAVIPLVFSPFILVTLGQALVAITGQEPSSQFHPHMIRPAGPLHNSLATNIVWIIFDETDYRLCFEKRPPNLSLPEFDRFRHSAFWATQAYSPNDETQVSIPALLTGIPLKGAFKAGARQLDLVRADTGVHADFTTQDTIFRQIKKRNGSTALLGWYHPYSRIMRDADICHDYPRYNFYTSDNLFDTFLCQTREILDMRFLPFKNTLLVNNHIQILKQMQSQLLDTVKDNDVSFMFLHYSIPHSPNIYDRRTGTFGLNRNTREGYLDNMALADRCLRELRLALEKKGRWDSSMIVISSDHHWRTNTYDGQTDYKHVPFMVKMPHQETGIVFDKRFDTVITKELILDVVDGKVTSAEDVAQWLARRR